MVLISLPYVKAYEVKGKTYCYYRRDGSKIRIKGDLGSDAWRAEYERIHEEFQTGANGGKKVTPGSYDDLIAKYKASPIYKQLKPRTKKEYSRHLDTLGSIAGKMDVKSTPRKFVTMLHNRFHNTPRTANAIVSQLRIILNYAIDLGWLMHNPASRPRRLKEGEGFRSWEENEIEQFRAHWAMGTRERTAFELILYTGQRASDVRTMVRGHIKNGWISVKQQKTAARVEIPLSNVLQQALDIWLPDHDHLNLIPAPKGKAYDATAFSKMMRKAYDAADLPADFTAHGGRYAAATRLRELGLSWEEIGAITGHETAQMVRKYSERKRAASLAIDKLNRLDQGA
ncbi:tyrosine-type recombinase/integrase [Thalassospira sp. B30-1]|jgi:integrase|uniref:tyrosine-type recombinase/integrase n=1 Tax=Thalassospira sp. B30-1 TaxID=2785911 RepID=UPI0018C9A58D|nr:tyrosine-type recombinase/integrase [Thalassospira sp. B30-1]QPL37219.1 tyrosine-type recombinase/integrase [Thalassospira sp. B30-1]